MIEAIIQFAVRQKLLIALMTLLLILGGVFALRNLPIDAVPDITNNQVQVVTVGEALAPQEVEQFITYPVEVAMANIPDVEEIRSISRFGLSIVTIVFKPKVPILDSRQLVKEQIDAAIGEIPEGLGTPELMPITTGLGEIYQYVLEVAPGYEYSPMELRTIQDWIVKRQLSGIQGIIEVSSFGGYLKQYEVSIDPMILRAQGISMAQVFEALENNNQNTGGSYIERGNNALYIRTEGLLESLSDIQSIVVARKNGIPVKIGDLAEVRFGSPKRFGAMTMDGKGEAVGGITLMLKGANSAASIANVKKRVEEIQSSLPQGVSITPYLDRANLIAKTTHTVEKNLLEGGLIVILVLILLLGNWRAGLIVASIIPLSMLFAIILMRVFNVSANLMSLGAIDFGIVVDGAVIVVEGILFYLTSRYAGQKINAAQMDQIVTQEASKLFRSAVFGVFIILVVFIPIMTLSGIEGKMFRPMGVTFSFVVIGALILSLTYVPMLVALLMPKQIRAESNLSERFIDWIKHFYAPLLSMALAMRGLVLTGAVVLLLGAGWIFSRLGAEFIPTLEEGDLAMQMAIQPGSSLEESIKSSTKAEQLLLADFPEIKHIVSKIGTAEIPTDPMAIEDADIMIILKDKKDWVSATTRDELVEKMKGTLSVILGASFEFTQPIQLRFNELMSGSKADIAVNIYGEDTDSLRVYGERASRLIEPIEGAADVKLEQTEGLPQLRIVYNRNKIAEYGLDIASLNRLVRMAYAGESAGVIFENERKFDLVVRLLPRYRDAVDLSQLFVALPEGGTVPMQELASLDYTEGPMQITREDTRRRISVGVNVRSRDVASLVSDIQSTLEEQLNLAPGYSVRYGGQFENLQSAQRRLQLAVPATLFLIFLLLYFTFDKIKYALLIFSAVPLSAIGGIAALWIRDMPFSISAGVGFIALFGVSVLNGIVLISYYNRLQLEKPDDHIKSIVIEGSLARLRPVLMTATVAALGFLPMAISTSNGAEVQKPLASVVIGGLISATILTLILLPVLYYWIETRSKRRKAKSLLLLVLAGLALPQLGNSQTLELSRAIDSALIQHPLLRNAAIQERIAELGPGQARQIPALNLNLNLGQFNTRTTDFNFSASQGLGNIAEDRQRKVLAGAQIQLMRQQSALWEYQVVSEVEKAWHQWRHESLQVHKLLQLEALYLDQNTRADQLLQAGAIGALEQSLVKNQLLQLRQQIAQAKARTAQAKNQLMRKAWIKNDDFSADTTYLELSFPLETSINPVLNAVATQRVNTAREARILSQKAFSPQWNFSVFHQSIDPLFPLFGAGVGVQIPLFRKAGNNKIQALQLQQLQYQNLQASEWQELELELNKQETLVRNYKDLLDDSGQELLTQANILRQLAAQQLEAGEIDYFRFLLANQTALQNELEYLTLLNQYNQAVLHYRYLTQ